MGTVTLWRLRKRPGIWIIKQFYPGGKVLMTRVLPAKKLGEKALVDHKDCKKVILN